MYDEFQVNYIVLMTKMKATKLKETYINKWWNIVQNTIQKEIDNASNQYHVDEKL
jgi:hypothetical protein